MFTGIIRAQGRLAAVGARAGGREVVVAGVPATWAAGAGESVAVDGVCLTVEARSADTARFYLSGETLERTTAAAWIEGRRVHLEPALRVGDPLGGHQVQGHVEAVVQVLASAPRGVDRQLRLELPRGELLVDALVPKGSVALDGVSLTINEVDDEGFAVNLIPHTLAETHLGALAPGDRLNLETDPVARQVAWLARRHGERPVSR